MSHWWPRTICARPEWGLEANMVDCVGGTQFTCFTGTHFTCFTGTTVHILTPEERCRCGAGYECVGARVGERACTHARRGRRRASSDDEVLTLLAFLVPKHSVCLLYWHKSTNTDTCSDEEGERGEYEYGGASVGGGGRELASSRKSTPGGRLGEK